MNVVLYVLGGWLGLNVAFVAVASLAAWRRRHEPVPMDVHYLLDGYRR